MVDITNVKLKVWSVELIWYIYKITMLLICIQQLSGFSLHWQTDRWTQLPFVHIHTWEKREVIWGQSAIKMACLGVKSTSNCVQCNKIWILLYIEKIYTLIHDIARVPPLFDTNTMNFIFYLYLWSTEFWVCNPKPWQKKGWAQVWEQCEAKLQLRWPTCLDEPPICTVYK